MFVAHTSDALCRRRSSLQIGHTAVAGTSCWCLSRVLNITTQNPTPHSHTPLTGCGLRECKCYTTISLVFVCTEFEALCSTVLQMFVGMQVCIKTCSILPRLSAADSVLLSVCVCERRKKPSLGCTSKFSVPREIGHRPAWAVFSDFALVQVYACMFLCMYVSARACVFLSRSSTIVLTRVCVSDQCKHPSPSLSVKACIPRTYKCDLPIYVCVCVRACSVWSRSSALNIVLVSACVCEHCNLSTLVSPVNALVLRIHKSLISTSIWFECACIVQFWVRLYTSTTKSAACYTECLSYIRTVYMCMCVRVCAERTHSPYIVAQCCVSTSLCTKCGPLQYSVFMHARSSRKNISASKQHLIETDIYDFAEHHHGKSHGFSRWIYFAMCNSVLLLLEVQRHAQRSTHSTDRCRCFQTCQNNLEASVERSSITPDISSLNMVSDGAAPTDRSFDLASAPSPNSATLPATAEVVGGPCSVTVKPACTESAGPSQAPCAAAWSIRPSILASNPVDGSEECPNPSSVDPTSSTVAGDSVDRAVAGGSARKRPGKRFTRAERREFWTKKQAMNVALDEAKPAITKRQRSDDSTVAPSSKKSTVVEKVAAPSNLEVVILNTAVENGALTNDNIETVRFELSSLLLAQDPNEFGPEFEYVGSAGGWLDLRCKNLESKEWLTTNIAVLNSRLVGQATLSVRTRSEMRTHKVSAFFPVPRTVEQSFVTGLLLRQNRSLPINTWRVIRFDTIQGKDSNNPSAGSGYFALFEVDSDSLQALKALSFKVSFALTSVTMREQCKASTAETPEVDKVDGMTSHAGH